MADRQDFGPFPPAIARALSDRMYEKRKSAALEIEKLVKDLAAHDNQKSIDTIITLLDKDFVKSSNASAKKGGLIGLAATAIGLGKEAVNYLPRLLNPVIVCFNDADSRTRYSACEALYNIVKMTRSGILKYFNQIFDVLSKLVSDPDINVRNGLEPLDKLMKDIVSDSPTFDVQAFVFLLRERMYTKHSFARQFILSWITTLDSIPDINLLGFLPDILDGLFTILGDYTKEIQRMCEFCLNEFLQKIKKNPSGVNFAALVKVLIQHSKSTDLLIQITSITWIGEFLKLAERRMLPFTALILQQILPCLSVKDQKFSVLRDVANQVNHKLMQLITSADDLEIPSTVTEKRTNEKKKIQETDVKKQTGAETPDRKCVAMDAKDGPLPTAELQKEPRLSVADVVEVLKNNLTHKSMETRIAVLQWVLYLLKKTPKKMFQQMDSLFSLMISTLSDPTDEVLLLLLEVLSEIVQSKQGPHYMKPSTSTKEKSDHSHTVPGMNLYFTRCMTSIIDLFSTNNDLLSNKGSFIIRQLCLFLNAEHIYRSLSENLQEIQELKFATNMIQVLNEILLTSTELFLLRNQLKDLKDENSCSLFCCLYKSWCHSPVATVSLCFLTQCYKHACDLIFRFGSIEVTVDFLTELDKLVQLIESPVFTYLRLQLLDVDNSPYLVKSLYGILMLLPQSRTFELLHHRLACVPLLQAFPSTDNKKTFSGEKRTFVKLIKWAELLDHFDVIQLQHSKLKQLRNRALDERMKHLGVK